MTHVLEKNTQKRVKQPVCQLKEKVHLPYDV